MLSFGPGQDPTAAPTPGTDPTAGMSPAAAAPVVPPAAMPAPPDLPGLGDLMPDELALPVVAGGRPDGPDAALAALLAGNARFVAGRPAYGHTVASARAAALTPAPLALVVTCLDPRIPVEAVFDQDIGALSAVRSAGHVLDNVALASVEFAVEALGVGLIVVLGHTRCAAVSAAIEAWRTDKVPHGHLRHVAEQIGAAIHDVEPGRPDLQEVVAHRHTDRTVARLQSLVGVEHATVVGAHYEVETGRVRVAGP